MRHCNQRGSNSGRAFVTVILLMMFANIVGVAIQHAVKIR